MKRFSFCAVFLLWFTGSVYSQESLLKFFAGEWEGTVKYFNPQGKEIGKYKAKRVLNFVKPDTLEGSLEYQNLPDRIQKTQLQMVEKGKTFLLLHGRLVLEGTYRDKTFTFYGRDDSLHQEISQSHFFVGGDQEFFTVEQTDPKTNKKFVRLRGVLRLKKD